NPSALDEAWRTLLLHEFHDILPGSSIREVYRDAREAFTRLDASLEELVERGLEDVVKRIGAPAGSLLVFNPSPFMTTALVEMPAHSGTDIAGASKDDAERSALQMQPAQQFLAAPHESQIGHGAVALVDVPNVPALGYRLLVPTTATA